jgi:MscS family membrane protein
VLGLISAARKRNLGLAALYLNTPLRGAEAETLASQLAEVINRRLPARINEISDVPEGSQRDPLKPDEDLVGVIQTANGDIDILVERIDRGKAGKVWLFSRTTLASIPSAFQELNDSALERFLPHFMITTRVAEIPLYEFVAIFLGMPLYWLTGVAESRCQFGCGCVAASAAQKCRSAEPQVLRPQFARCFLRSLSDGWPRRFLCPSWLGSSGLPQH